MPNQNQQRQQQLSSGQNQKKKKKKKPKKKKMQALTVLEKQESVLRHLQEIFKDTLDSVLIHAILEENNYEVEIALTTLLILAEEAASSIKQGSSVPSFKDIKDRLSRPVDDDEDDDGDDDDSGDDSSQLEEEDYSLDLPLLPNNSHDTEHAQIGDIPYSAEGSRQPRHFGKPSYYTTTPTPDIDELLARSRFDQSHDRNPSRIDELPPHMNGYHGNQQVNQPGPSFNDPVNQPGPYRTECGGVPLINDHGSLHGYHLPHGDTEDVATSNSKQEYLSTYYGGYITQEYYSPLPEDIHRMTQADPNPSVPHRTAPYHNNTYRNNAPNYTGTVQGGGPSWPKKKSHVVRNNHPKQQNVEKDVDPLPLGKVLCLLRGLPGSGKSTLAKKLLRPGSMGVIISTDDFFLNRDGTYNFNPHDLDKAHQSTQRKAKRTMEKGLTPVIIDNTNTQLWEMKPYVQMAVASNYHVEVREPTTPWRNNVYTLARRNKHGVPVYKLEQMLQRFEKLDSVVRILEAPDKTKPIKDTETNKRRGVGEGNVRGKSPHRGRIPPEVTKTKEITSSVGKVTKEPHVLGQTFQSQQYCQADVPESGKAQHHSGVVEDKTFRERSDTQVASVTDQTSKNKQMEDSETASNLSEIQTVITSIPLASCLKENFTSFQEKLSQITNFDDLYKSSGSDDILPKRDILKAAKEKDKSKSGGMSPDKESPRQGNAADGMTKINHADRKVNDAKWKVMTDADARGKRRNPIVRSEGKVEDSEGTGIGSPYPASTSSKIGDSHGNQSKPMRRGSDKNTTRRESRPAANTGSSHSGVKEFAKYLTATELDDEAIELRDLRDPLTASRRDGSTKIEERLLGSGKPSHDPRTSETGKTIPYISAHAEVSNHPSAAKGQKKVISRRGDIAKDASAGTSWQTRVYRVEDDDTDSESRDTKRTFKCVKMDAEIAAKSESHRGEGMRTDHRHAATLADSNQGQTFGSEWEESGARPKFKRAISEPIITLSSSEDPGRQAISPIGGDSSMLFRSISTVPRTKKRPRRAPTPFAKRSLAPTFSAPALAPLSEQSPTRGEVPAMSPLPEPLPTRGVYREHVISISKYCDLTSHKSNTGLDTHMENVNEGMKYKTNIMSPSDDSHESVSAREGRHVINELQTNPELEETPRTQSGGIVQHLKTEDQPIKRKVARTSKPSLSPLLNDETRQMAMTLNWSSGAIKKEVLSPQESVVHEYISHNIPETKHQSSQTDPSHFQFLEKVSSTRSTESPVPGHLWIKDVSQKAWTVDETRQSRAEREDHIPHRRKIDQSSMTEVMMNDPHTNLRMLHSIFPNLEEAQIKGVLRDCHGNVQWASEVLVELIHEADNKERKHRKRNEKKALTTAQGSTAPPKQLLPGVDKSSQTSRVDLLELKLINEGATIREHIPDVNVVVTREWISTPGGAASNNMDGRFIEAETMASLDEAMPLFDQHLAQLLQGHLDIPFLEVCELLERNGGHLEKTRTELRVKFKGKEGRSSLAPTALSEELTPNRMHHSFASPCKVNETRETTGINHPLDNRGHSTGINHPLDTRGHSKKDSVSSISTTGFISRRNELDKKPTVVKKENAPNRLREEQAASFSDQEAPNYQRGRTSQSLVGPSQRRPHQRRSKSLPRKRSPHRQEKKVTTGDSKPKQMTATKARQQKSHHQQKVQNIDEHEKRASQATGDKKPPGRAGLGRHLGAREEEMHLPNKYSFQELKRKQKQEENNVATDEEEPSEMESNSQERSERVHKNEASNIERARATPSELLGEEGKGVPTRFHEGMTFQLDMAFALQLQEIFGPVGYNIDTDVLSEDDLSISVDLQLAKTIHSAWSQSFQRKFEREERQLLEMMKQDEAFAKQLQQEEEKKEMEAVQKRREKEYLSKSHQPLRGVNAAGSPTRTPGSPGPRNTGRTETFRDIMDDELAEELSRKMQMEEVLSSGASTSMATNLKRQDLVNKYPGVDKSWLENIFMTFNFDFEATVWHIDDIINTTSQPRIVYSEEAVQEHEDSYQVIQNRRSSPQIERRSVQPQDDDDEIDLKQNEKFQSINHPDYADYRAEANQHYQQRQECFRKASEAFRNGKTDQAAYYSQQGHKHTALLQEANERASEAILTDRNKERDNDTIDLHGLHADEAVQVLQRTIEDKVNRLKYSTPYLRPSHQLNIITGRGNHSKGGVARVKPAVLRYLAAKGFRWTPINEGKIRINLA